MFCRQFLDRSSDLTGRALRRRHQRRPGTLHFVAGDLGFGEDLAATFGVPVRLECVDARLLGHGVADRVLDGGLEQAPPDIRAWTSSVTPPRAACDAANASAASPSHDPSAA